MSDQETKIKVTLTCDDAKITAYVCRACALELAGHGTDADICDECKKILVAAAEEQLGEPLNPETTKD